MAWNVKAGLMFLRLGLFLNQSSHVQLRSKAFK